MQWAGLCSISAHPTRCIPLSDSCLYEVYILVGEAAHAQAILWVGADVHSFNRVKHLY